jgi:hypothetical protein
MYKMRRDSEEYLVRVQEFLQFAESYRVLQKEADILCPCRDCKNCIGFEDLDEIRTHLICRGFQKRYTCWFMHSEKIRESSGTGKFCDEINENAQISDNFEFDCNNDYANFENLNNVEVDSCDDDEMTMNIDENVEHEFTENLEDMLRDVEGEIGGENYDKFQYLSDESKKPLYPGCTAFTKLSAVLKLLNLKADSGWSDKSFTSLLQLLREMLPNNNELPCTIYQAKKLICPVGLKIERIHACPNDCVLYRKEYESMDVCPKCGVSRYKRKGMETDDCNDEGKKDRPPAKVLWYLPVIPRFKRLFANSKDAKLLRWHEEERKKDGKLRHPADSPQWRNIDRQFKEFGSDPRNLRIVVSTDGMSPFGSMSSQHSTWPVLLSIYNLPPWLCMKRKYIMMSLLIQGPRQPGNDIDVYLAPLIEDLQKLWKTGVWVWDAYSKEVFKLRAMVFCTVNDFPAYGNLSGYSTKGAKACPICEDDTQVLRLKYCKKNVFMGHRRFLPVNHPYRRRKKSFNGKNELGVARRPLDGKGVFKRVMNLDVVFGKCAKAPPKNIWKKKSIFWDLPYWEYLEVRHCLDVMHVEKNVCDSLIGTLLNIPRLTKDGINARKDMVEMGIRQKLAPQDKGKRAYLPPAMCTMSKEEKKSFCQCLHSIKVPSGYSSNIKKLVSMKDMKLKGMKSHDCHVLMTQMIPVAIRGILPKAVRQTITKLCFFFNAINSKVIDPLKLDALQAEVVVTLCHLEMYFPPSFFDVMVHLVIHLVREIKICGPVFLRYMYPFERYMGILKKYVRNRHRPEGSIVEGYSTEEAVEFCTNYLTGVSPIGVPKSRYEGRLQGVGTIGSKAVFADTDELQKAHFIVLQHMADVAPYVDEHMTILRQLNYTRSQKWLNNEHNRSFTGWLKERVKEHPERSPVDEIVRLLGEGPQVVVRTFQGYEINGYTFYTKLQSDKSATQNSGVMLVADSEEFSRSGDARAVIASKSYYGVIEEIWELIYSPRLNIPLFRCQWVEDRGVKVDNNGFTLVDFNKVGYVDDPFILAKQATQVFYVTDPSDARWSIVLSGKRRILGVENVVDEEEYDQFDEIPPLCTDVPIEVPISEEEANYIRSDHNEGLWADVQKVKKKRKRKKKSTV